MNEQIQSLAEQAGQESFDSDYTSLLQVSTEHAMYEVPAGFIAKFAELIVQECLHIVDDEGAGEGGCIRAMIRIQEQFGVEQ